jgi:uncharacterized damage-inducible protein DinB
MSNAISQGFLAELEHEFHITRKFIERLPEDKLTWKPHAKSMTAGQLALHLATTPGQVAEMAAINPAPPPDFSKGTPQPTSVQEILDAFEHCIQRAKEVVPAFDDASMHETWRVMAGNQVIYALPRAAFLRAIMLNHWYQHRGQFGVYLRLLDIPVPSSYGPSADEMPDFMTAKQQA